MVWPTLDNKVLDAEALGLMPPPEYHKQMFVYLAVGLCGNTTDLQASAPGSNYGS